MILFIQGKKGKILSHLIKKKKSQKSQVKKYLFE